MFHNVINTRLAPPPGNYSQGRVVDCGAYTVVHISGQTGNDPITDEVVPGGIGPQTRQALKNIGAVVSAAGGVLEDIAEITVFMENMERDKAGFEQAYLEMFQGVPLPARALVEVSRVPLHTESTVVEIKATAYVRR